MSSRFGNPLFPNDLAEFTISGMPVVPTLTSRSLDTRGNAVSYHFVIGQHAYGRHLGLGKLGGEVLDDKCFLRVSLPEIQKREKPWRTEFL